MHLNTSKAHFTELLAYPQRESNFRKKNSFHHWTKQKDPVNEKSVLHKTPENV